MSQFAREVLNLQVARLGEDNARMLHGLISWDYLSDLPHNTIQSFLNNITKGQQIFCHQIPQLDNAHNGTHALGLLSEYVVHPDKAQQMLAPANSIITFADVRLYLAAQFDIKCGTNLCEIISDPNSTVFSLDNSQVLHGNTYHALMTVICLAPFVAPEENSHHTIDPGKSTKELYEHDPREVFTLGDT